MNARLLTATLGLALAACAVEAGGRDGGDDRGTWNGNGKFDENATCQLACGGVADAGCWCDEQCVAHGDCCPDKVSFCGGAGPADGLPGVSLGVFDAEYWTIADALWFDEGSPTTIYDFACSPLGSVPSDFVEAVIREGRGRMPAGGVIEFFGECQCDPMGCFVELDEGAPWGTNLFGEAMAPFRSIAVDPNVIEIGAPLYIPALDGLEIPGEAPWGGFVHDGCVVADNAANAYDGDAVGVFAAFIEYYLTLEQDLPPSLEIFAAGDACGGGGDDPIDDDPTPEPLPPADPNGLCFLGPSGASDACVALVPAATAGYVYPPPYAGDANYRAPIAVIDLQVESWSLSVAPSFVLGEFAQAQKGRYAVVQPHAVAKMQEIRNKIGALRINSGYRPPSYNQMIGGAANSRHMYGDGFDFSPLSTTLAAGKQACKDVGGTLVEYGTHVHCDFRTTPLDTKLYGAAAVSDEVVAAEDGYDGSIVADGASLRAVPIGFDEGEPVVRWRALDADGRELGRHEGATWTSPPGAARVDVEIGGIVHVSYAPPGAIE